MSALGVVVLKNLVRLRQKVRTHSATGRAEGNWESYFRWQFESSALLFARYPNWNIAGKTVLEIGCGTGGRTAYLAAAGAKCVIGIDINREEIALARHLSGKLHPDLSEQRLHYLEASEDEPLKIGPFDMVVLVDCMEHVVSPPKIMRLAHGYLVPGGQFYFSSVGWYHHSGSHTHLLPFVNVVFSDETILDTIRWWVSRPEYVPTRFDSDPPVERWRGLYNLRDRPGEHLNKITIREMKKLVNRSIFAYSRLTVLGFNRRHALVRMLNPLTKVPLIQELWHSGVVVECRK
jgi:2-polyprenyl-3-methyl-5-hydroxy-6-metoxy-1,4-benzoquinol methylase